MVKTTISPMKCDMVLVHTAKKGGQFRVTDPYVLSSRAMNGHTFMWLFVRFQGISSPCCLHIWTRHVSTGS